MRKFVALCLFIGFMWGCSVKSPKIETFAVDDVKVSTYKPIAIGSLYKGDMLLYTEGNLDPALVKTGCDYLQCDRVMLLWSVWHDRSLAEMKGFAAAIAPLKLGLHFMSAEATWKQLLMIRQLAVSDVYFDGMEAIGQGEDNLAAMPMFLASVMPYCRGVEWIESSADTVGCEAYITAVGTTDMAVPQPSEWKSPPVRNTDPYISVALDVARILSRAYPSTWANFSQFSVGWCKPFEIDDPVERAVFVSYARRIRDGLIRDNTRKVRIVYQAGSASLSKL
jgi:hypothetical protein